MASFRFLRLALPLFLVFTWLSVSCGGDGDTDPGASSNNDGGSSGSGKPDDPPLTGKECPAKPANVGINKVAPVWNGMIALTFKPTGGVGTIYETQVLEPALGVWRPYLAGTPQQKQDGTFLVLAAMQVTRDNKELDFKLRVRATLDGCPPSDWAESDAFKLGDPLKGTTWTATVTPEEASGAVMVASLTGGAGSATGPFHFDDDVVHTFEFQDDGTVLETFEFGVTSEHIGDLYDGCRYVVHYTGTWRIDFNPNATLYLHEMRPVSAPLTGSSCSSPALTQPRIVQEDEKAPLADVHITLNTDYTPLLYKTPGKARLLNTSLLAHLNAVISYMSDSVPPDTSNIAGALSFDYIEYQKH